MTPEQGAVELLRRVNPKLVTDDDRPDFDAIQDGYYLSSGEFALVDVALGLWRSDGVVGNVGRIVDRDNKAFVLGILSAVWLGGES